jgi:hypothetical protein
MGVRSKSGADARPGCERLSLRFANPPSFLRFRGRRCPRPAVNRAIEGTSCRARRNGCPSRAWQVAPAASRGWKRPACRAAGERVASARRKGNVSKRRRASSITCPYCAGSDPAAPRYLSYLIRDRPTCVGITSPSDWGFRSPMAAASRLPMCSEARRSGSLSRYA